MAEFCLECLLKLNANINPKDVMLSKEPDLCENCGEEKFVVIGLKKGF